MQHRNKESNAWLITQVNSLLDIQKDGSALWELHCRGKGNDASLYSNAIADKTEAETYQQYLTKKNIKCRVEPSDAAFRIIVPVAGQQMKKTRFNTTHTELSGDHALEKILKMLNDATPAALGKWEISANHAGQRIIVCLAHQSSDQDGAHLAAMINKILQQGAFSEESRRSIRHYFLDNLYVESHDNYTMYIIIDLAFMEQIETIESMSS